MAKLDDFSSSYYVNGILVDTSNRIVKIRGKEIPFVEGMTGMNVKTVDNNITIDGYRLKNNEWQATLPTRIKHWIKRKNH